MLNSLYFESDVPATMPFSEVKRIGSTGYALPVPMYVRFTARGHPIVGTTLDYFDFRGLRIAEGTNLRILGDAVLGARVAEELGVEGLVECSILRSGNEVRITAQLIHGATDSHLWAEHYVGTLDNILKLQG